VGLFYAGDCTPSDILPSLTVSEEPDSMAPIPATWEIRPEFFTENGKGRATISYPENADLYGTGEGVGPLRKNGREVIMWNTDNYAYATDEGKRLYQSHPWVLGVREDGSAFGILADNTWKQTFYLEHPLHIESEGPPFRIFILEGESPQEVMTLLGSLTGTMDLPPLWALGYQQCRYSYYPDTRVMEIANAFREKQIPCDVIWMDIDYMNGYRIFTFDPSGFSDPAALNQYLHNLDFKTVYMIDPGVKEDAEYFVYQQGTDADIWVQDAGEDEYHGDVWPGSCAFPDFTMPGAREWWSGLYEDFMSLGIDGVWNDMNEPAVFNGPDNSMPTDNIHRGGDGLPEDVHLRYHNVYGMLMVQATREGVMTANPEKRPFVLTRANYIGGNRYAATWTGDNVSSWDHLRLSIPMSLNLSLSGQLFSGSDIGGFSGSPTPELLAHWMAVGAFYPFSRNHTSSGTADQEPWALGTETEQASRLALNRRYRLLPYYYTLFREASQIGLPVMQPVFFADPTNPALRSEQEAFMIGEALLVVPRWADKPALPNGLWRKISVAGEDYTTESYQPFLKQKEGTVIPLAQPMLSTEGFCNDSITLLVSPDAERMAEGRLYADEGNGFAYQTGYFNNTRFEVLPHGTDSLRLICHHESGLMELPDRIWRIGLVYNYGIVYSGWCADSVIYIPYTGDLLAEISEPEEGQEFDEMADINIKANTKGTLVVDKVKFFANDQLIATDKTAPYEYHWQDVESGIYYLSVQAVVQDTLQVSSDAIKIKVGNPGDGEILRQIWTDIPGYLITDFTSDPDYPDNPDQEDLLTTFSSPINQMDNYGSRIIGYVHPPQDGDFIFSINGDDYCELWLSPDENYATLELIAEVPGWTSPGEWDKYPEQESEAITLEKGKKYAIMALQKEDGVGDHVQVAWTYDEQIRNIIEGDFLSAPDETPIGIPGTPALETLRIYPNPASEILHITGPKNSWQMELVNLSGQVIYQQTISQNQTEINIDISHITAGLYIVRLYSQQQVNSKKILIRQ
jgi:alpha-glucosidase